MDDRRLTSLQLNVPNDIDFLDGERNDRYKVIHKFGARDDIGNTIVQDIHPFSDDFYDWPTAGFHLEVISNDAGDNPAGLGARLITIQGLSWPDFLEIEENVETNGLNASAPTVQLFARENRSFVKESGIYATTATMDHLGDITIQTQGGGQIHDQIVRRNNNTLALGQSMLARYSTPANAQTSLQKLVLNADNVQKVTISFFKREDADIITPPCTAKRIDFGTPMVQGERVVDLENPLDFKGKTDLWFAAIGKAGATNQATVNMELVNKYN